MLNVDVYVRPKIVLLLVLNLWEKITVGIVHNVYTLIHSSYGTNVEFVFFSSCHSVFRLEPFSLRLHCEQTTAAATHEMCKFQ